MVTSWRGRHAWLVAVLVALAVAGLSAPVPAWAPPLPPIFEIGTTPWAGARVAGDGRSLVIAYTGGRPNLSFADPCWTGHRATVTETTSIVTVTMMRLGLGPGGPPAGRGCTLIGFDQAATIELRSPLGGRAVVDGSTGAERPVYGRTARALARPSFLPHGWKLLSEGPWGTDPEPGLLWRQFWGPSGRSERCGTSEATIELVQGVVTDLFPYGPGEDADLVRWRGVGRAVAQVVVDHRLRQTTVRWKDRGVGYVVRRVAACSGDPTPRPELMVRVAGSVR